jgi:hypothetical protein
MIRKKRLKMARMLKIIKNLLKETLVRIRHKKSRVRKRKSKVKMKCSHLYLRCMGNLRLMKIMLSFSLSVILLVYQ